MLVLRRHANLVLVENTSTRQQAHAMLVALLDSFKIPPIIHALHAVLDVLHAHQRLSAQPVIPHQDIDYHLVNFARFVKRHVQLAYLLILRSAHLVKDL